MNLGALLRELKEEWPENTTKFKTEGGIIWYTQAMEDFVAWCDSGRKQEDWDECGAAIRTNGRKLSIPPGLTAFETCYHHLLSIGKGEEAANSLVTWCHIGGWADCGEGKPCIEGDE